MVRGGHQHVFIGKEVYTNVVEGYTLRDFIPKILQLRMKGMEMSGIWEWWNKIIERKYLAKNKWVNVVHRNSAMSGNVQIIFIVLLIGMVIAAAAFFLESCKILLRKCHRFISIFLFTIWWFERTGSSGSVCGGQNYHHTLKVDGTLVDRFD